MYGILGPHSPGVRIFSPKLSHITLTVMWSCIATCKRCNFLHERARPRSHVEDVFFSKANYIGNGLFVLYLYTTDNKMYDICVRLHSLIASVMESDLWHHPAFWKKQDGPVLRSCNAYFEWPLVLLLHELERQQRPLPIDQLQINERTIQRCFIYKQFFPVLHCARLRTAKDVCCALRKAAEELKPPKIRPRSLHFLNKLPSELLLNLLNKLVPQNQKKHHLTDEWLYSEIHDECDESKEHSEIQYKPPVRLLLSLRCLNKRMQTLVDECISSCGILKQSFASVRIYQNSTNDIFCTSPLASTCSSLWGDSSSFECFLRARSPTKLYIDIEDEELCIENLPFLSRIIDKHAIKCKKICLDRAHVQPNLLVHSAYEQFEEWAEKRDIQLDVEIVAPNIFEYR